MSHLDHDEIMELLGAYALDSVEPDEATEIAQHLEHCARCTSELASFREVTGLIANSGGNAPPHLWQAIAAQIEVPSESQEPPAPRHLFTKADAPRGESRRGRWRATRPWVFGAVAAALLVIAGLGVQVGRLEHQVNQLRVTSAQGAIAHQADTALANPQARQVALAAPHSAGPAVAHIAVLPSGTAFLVNDHLPRLAASHTYQLWGQVNGELISLAVLGPAPSSVSFHTDPGAPIASFAVTVERAGGVVHSAHSPVAVSPADL